MDPSTIMAIAGLASNSLKKTVNSFGAQPSAVDGQSMQLKDINALSAGALGHLSKFKPQGQTGGFGDFLKKEGKSQLGSLLSGPLNPLTSIGGLFGRKKEQSKREKFNQLLESKYKTAYMADDQRGTVEDRDMLDEYNSNPLANADFFGALGGNMASGNTSFEVEDEEVMVTPQGVNLSGGGGLKKLASGISEVQGNTHEEGGVKGSAPDGFVFSDRLEMDPEYTKKLNKLLRTT